jgi:hypothetical protein
MITKKNKRPNARGSPTPLSLEVKVTASFNSNGFPSNLATVIDQIMKAQGGVFERQGTSLVSGNRDFIYSFGQVIDETALMDDLKSHSSAKLNCQLTLEAFAPLDAYPGEAFMYGYSPGHLVRQRR